MNRMSDGFPSSGSSTKHPWVGFDGDVAHPNAPAGGGGPGGFTSGSPLGADPKLFPAAPHPHSPVARYLTLSGTQAENLLAERTQDESPIALNTGGAGAPAAANAPPQTVPSKKSLKKEKNNQVDIDVQVEVLADGKSADPNMAGAKTKYDVSSVSFQTPGYQHDGKNVTKLNSLFTMKGTVKIQTTYGPNSTPAQRSQYGRGTTQADEQAGDTSLGFHESCHRADYLQYLDNHELPVFEGKVGMTIAEFDAAVAEFPKKFQKYFDDMGAESLQQTDEVGYTRTEYKQKGPRK